MQDLMVLVFMLIGLAALGILILVTWGICELVNHIKEQKHKKWCAWLFENYPNLKVLLSEYHRLRSEHIDTVRSAYNLQRIIDEWVEQNKYLPRGHRVDAHIEALKEQYQELLDIRAEQSELVDRARDDLENFWKSNFPDLREDRWLMWWSE